MSIIRISELKDFKNIIEECIGEKIDTFTNKNHAISARFRIWLDNYNRIIIINSISGYECNIVISLPEKDNLDPI